MYKNKKISVVMPCRNEGNHLKKVVKKIPNFVDEIIVVSNCSSDNTVAVARKLGLVTIEDNRTLGGIGYGYAHMSGIQAASGDIVVGVDADGTYPIEVLADAIDYMLLEKADFVSCNRYPVREGTHIPFKLKFGVALLNLETQILYGTKINDILSGMWVFRKQAKKKLALTMGDWNLSPQIKVNAAIHPQLVFREFHISQHQREGETKQNYISTGVSHATWLVRNRLRQQ